MKIPPNSNNITNVFPDHQMSDSPLQAHVPLTSRCYLLKCVEQLCVICIENNVIICHVLRCSQVIEYMARIHICLILCTLHWTCQNIIRLSLEMMETFGPHQRAVQSTLE